MRGSLVNTVLDGSGEPKIGGGATVLLHSDRRAATVIEIVPFKSGPNRGKPRKVVVQEDNWKVIGGSVQDGSAAYAYQRNTEGMFHTFIWSKCGWRTNGLGITFGHRNHHIDPGF